MCFISGMKISSACVNHRPYFRRLTKIPFKKPIDFKTREPVVQREPHFRVSGLIPLPLYSVISPILMVIK